jgi:hypothetical protein
VLIARRALLIGGSFVALLAVASVASFLSVYLPAARRVSSALAEVPDELHPPPAAFVRATLCVHPNGVSHIAARRLLSASGHTGGRALAWAVRYYVWTKAVQWRSTDGGVGLFANTMIHKAGSGLVAGAQAYFGKAPAELTPSESLDLIVADKSPDGLAPERLEALRRRCL